MEGRLGKKDAELKKQKQELQTLRVRKWLKILLYMHNDLTNGFRRPEEDWEKWRLEWARRMLNSTSKRKSYKY